MTAAHPPRHTRSAESRTIQSNGLLPSVYKCAYNRSWITSGTPTKQNLRKHGVAFADAVAVLENDRAKTIRDRASEAEERWVTLGMDGLGRVLVVVYTWRGDRLRLITARRATPAERSQYEEKR